MIENQERKNRAKVYKYEHRPGWQKLIPKISKTILILLLVPCGIFAILDPHMWFMIAGLLLIDPLIDRK